MKDTRTYYRDQEKGGCDQHPSHGIESPTLLFYAGHGIPSGFQAMKLREWFYISDMIIGDLDLRYFLMCSCNVMAHGPATERLTSTDYPKPWEYPQSCDAYAEPDCRDGMENVFSRWFHSIGPNLRFVCGGSTRICGGDATVPEQFWRHYGRMPIADAFLYAAKRKKSVPMCLTRWDAELDDLPFRDGAITEELPRQTDRSYMYIMYPRPIRLDVTRRYRLEEALPPNEMPVLPTRELDLEMPEALDLVPEGAEWVSPDGRLRVHRLTGSWSYRGEVPTIREVGESGGPPTEEELLGRGLQTVAEFLFGSEGWRSLLTFHIDLQVEGLNFIMETAFDGDSIDPNSGYVFVVNRSSDLGETVENLSHSETIEFRRWIELPESASLPMDLRRVPVIGPGGRLRVQTGADGEPALISFDWHALELHPLELYRGEHGEADWQEVMTFEEALRTAKDRLQDLDHYTLDDFRWGYWEEAGHCAQATLSVAYEFDFVAAEGHSAATNPPRQIVVHAQEAGRNRTRCPSWSDE